MEELKKAIRDLIPKVCLPPGKCGMPKPTVSHPQQPASGKKP